MSHLSASFMIIWPWMISFSIKSQILVKAALCASSRSSCVSCFLRLHYHWVGFTDTACDSCFKNVLKTFDPSIFFILFMFFSFKHCLPALKFRHFSGFSCLNTFLFDLLLHSFSIQLSLCITKNTVPFENYFSEAVEERADVQFCVLNCFRIICGRSQAIK